jgi:hypothetical protein
MIDLGHQAGSGPYDYDSDHMLELYDCDSFKRIAMSVQSCGLNDHVTQRTVC